MRKILFLFLILMVVTGMSAQQLTLRFTGKLSDETYIRLDSVKILNLTNSWEEIVEYPDTVLTLTTTGISDMSELQDAMELYPNPFNGTATLGLQLPEQDKVTLQVFNLAGQKVTELPMTLSAGRHYFDITLQKSQMYILSVLSSRGTSSMKMINQGRGGQNAITYQGKQMPLAVKKATTKPFSPGDQMQYMGYATHNGTLYSSRQVVQQQRTDETITLIFDLATPIVITDEVRNITNNSADILATVAFDGGSSVRSRGVCWSTTPNPTTAGYHTSNGSGTGEFVCQISGLAKGVTYYVRAYAVNEAGTSYGNELRFTTLKTSFICGFNKLTDFDKNEYNSVLIGKQCWMKESLRSEHYADGTEIPLGTTTSSSVAYRYAPGNHPFNVPVLGYLYNFPAAMYKSEPANADSVKVQGICPKGWHLPSLSEWEELFSYLRSDEKYWCDNDSNKIAKSLASKDYWLMSGLECSIGDGPDLNNASGFSAMPAGMRYTDSYGFRNFETHVYFWASSVDEGSNPYYLLLSSSSDEVSMVPFESYLGLSVRCICDDADPDTLFSCGTSTLKDYEGNEYHTIQVGEQCWMKENMRTAHYADGKAIEVGTSESSDTLAYCYYPDGNSEMVDTYGYLYNWAATMNGEAGSQGAIQGVCPDGWHVPSDAEWTALTTFISLQSQYVCNENTANIAKALASDQGWTPYNGAELLDFACFTGYELSSNNASGFGLLPAGCFNAVNGNTQSGEGAFLWSATPNGDFSYYRSLSYKSATVNRENMRKSAGYSVRCVR